MPNPPSFERVQNAWVARNPQNRGVVEFYGGAIFERCPTLFYEEYLQGLFEAGYNIVALTFPVSFDHTNVAVGLVETNRDLFEQVVFPPASSTFPHFRVGHSIGCKVIALIEILATQSASQNARLPSLLLAPDISGTDAAVPGPLAGLIDFLGWGVKPTEAQTKTLIAERHDVLQVTGLVSFAQDSIAGNAQGTLPKNGDSSVEWFIKTLSERSGDGSAGFFTTTQLPGRHLSPLGYDFEWKTRALFAGTRRAVFGRDSALAGRVKPIVETSVSILEQLQERIPD